HGLPLLLAAAVLADPAARTSIDRRRDYGEPRFITHGAVAGRVFVAVHTFRQEAHRLISARKANEKEAQRYRDGRAPA
ncbi:MAG: BrnT family toxin, partial [Alphaproteobacteria bacterium]|nr:BrnT family toxin [Alphaproteobacteria bacterium]